VSGPDRVYRVTGGVELALGRAHQAAAALHVREPARLFQQFPRTPDFPAERPREPRVERLGAARRRIQELRQLAVDTREGIGNDGNALAARADALRSARVSGAA